MVCADAAGVLFAAQAEPGFRNHDGIAGIVGIVLDRGGQPEPAGLQVDELAQVGDLLGSFVGNSSHVVLVNNELPGVGAVHLVHVNDSAIGDAPDLAEPGSALALDFRWRFAPAPQQVSQ